MLKNKAVRLIFQILPIGMLVITILVILFSGKSFTVETLLTYTPESYLRAAVFILTLYAAKSMSVALPISVLVVVTGTVFPVFAALALNTAGVAVCVVLTYWIGYFSGSEYADRMTAKYPKVKEYVEKQHENEWFISFFLRVCPLPCDVVGIYLGSLKTTFHKYIIAGMLGSMPGIVSATLLGVSIMDPFSPMCILSASMIVLLSISSFFIYRHIRKKKTVMVKEI